METNNWRGFKVGYIKNKDKKIGNGLFQIVNSVPYHKKDIVETTNGFGLNYITRSKFNNGIKCKVEKYDKFVINQAGTISFGAENANFFYQKEEYITGNKMYYLDTQCLSEYSAMFLQSVLEETFSNNFSFSDGLIPTRIYNEVILLPATPSGDPDWAYMEQYMKEMEEKAKKRLGRLETMRKQEKKKIDVSGWGEFKVGELFDIKPTKAYKLNNAFLLDDGNTPVLANSSYNNGIGGYSTLEATEKGNIITFSDTVDANTIFYQEHEFIGYAHVQGMYPKDNYKQQWNSYCLKFFASVFRETALLKGYNYGNKFRRDNAMKMSILLPVTSAGTPDWDYMEQYMREMEEKAKKILKGLL